MESPVQLANAGRGRKRAQQPEKWKRNVAKIARLVMCHACQYFLPTSFLLLFSYSNNGMPRLRFQPGRADIGMIFVLMFGVISEHCKLYVFCAYLINM